jgi:hypothetical protein
MVMETQHGRVKMVMGRPLGRYYFNEDSIVSGQEVKINSGKCAYLPIVPLCQEQMRLGTDNSLST